jgi:hypothetical protein
MGISIFNRCRTNPSAPAPNPDPSRYAVVATEQHGRYLLAMVRYLDATNFEGVKVMVYRDRTAASLVGPLDPHFAENGQGPIARFPPTVDGLAMARLLVTTLVAKEG